MVRPRGALNRGLLRALLLMMGSGFAGLGYQIVWTQQAALWLGHDGAAVLAVVTAFFGGLALGALLLGERIARSAWPARWYAACELAIAAWGALLLLGMAPAGAVLMQLTGAQPSPAWQWAVAFVGSFCLLLPATLAMGATLPAMAQVLGRQRPHGAPIALLYAGNTAGAVLGVLASAFWLLPGFGLALTAGLCLGLNLLCAVLALSLSAAPAPATDSPSLASHPTSRPTPHPTSHAASFSASGPLGSLATTKALWLLAATGLLGIGCEVLVVRVLSQVTENTVYTFALLLAVYLVGTALGAAAWQRWGAASADLDRQRSGLLQELALVCVLGGASLWQADAAKAALLQAGGGTMAAALWTEAGLALLAFGGPTLLMGALFSLLCTQACTAGIGFGRCLGVNTLGAAAAPLVVGVLLLPALGAKAVLLLLAAGYLALVPRRHWRGPLAAGAVVVGAALAVAAPELRYVDVPDGGHIISYQEGPTAAVSVVEDAEGVSRLRIDNHQQEGSSHSLLADARQALLPLLLHPAPRRALFLGLGTGITASSAAQDAQLQVDAVELLPEVVAASAHFTRAFNAGVPNPRLHLVTADARRFVRAGGPAYDLVVADNFHPARSGSGALYTVEHFRAVAARLAPGGVFCQWLPLHQLDLDSLRSIVRAFTTVHPGAWAMLATHSLDTLVLGLVARVDQQPFEMAALRQRLASVALPRSPADFGIADDLSLLGGFVAGPQALASFAGQAPVNTDDHPVVAYSAPRITYAPDSRPRERLLALLQALRPQPQELLANEPEPGWFARLAAYWAARDAFIAAGQAVRPVADVQQMLAQVQAPLLAVWRTSPDFRPAYDPLLGMAGALAARHPEDARALLDALVLLQPVRPEAVLAWPGRQQWGRCHRADQAVARRPGGPPRGCTATAICTSPATSPRPTPTRQASS